MFGKRSTDLVFNVELNTPFIFDYFWQGTTSVDDFCIQYVGIFNKGVFNKWGNTVYTRRPSVYFAPCSSSLFMKEKCQTQYSRRIVASEDEG